MAVDEQKEENGDDLDDFLLDLPDLPDEDQETEEGPSSAGRAPLTEEGKVVSKPSPEGESEDDDVPEEETGVERTEKISSSETGLHGRELKSKSDIKRLKKGARYEGRKVVTDDVKILKSLEEYPELPEDINNYYREPIRIEYYIPKESKFAVEWRLLYIPMIDPVPKPGHELLKEYMEENRFFDLFAIMDEHPRYITDILESYDNYMNMYETMSKAYKTASTENPEEYRSVFYLTEILAEYEPTMVSLNTLGEFIAYNMNWLVRTMNQEEVEFAASDKTISYFIKRRNIYVEENDLPYDERFEVLAALFYEQAFPNRGSKFEDSDFFYDIFDKKKLI